MSFTPSGFFGKVSWLEGASRLIQRRDAAAWTCGTGTYSTTCTVFQRKGDGRLRSTEHHSSSCVCLSMSALAYLSAFGKRYKISSNGCTTIWSQQHYCTASGISIRRPLHDFQLSLSLIRLDKQFMSYSFGNDCLKSLFNQWSQYSILMISSFFHQHFLPWLIANILISLRARYHASCYCYCYCHCINFPSCHVGIWMIGPDHPYQWDVQTWWYSCSIWSEAFVTTF